MNYGGMLMDGEIEEKLAKAILRTELPRVMYLSMRDEADGDAASESKDALRQARASSSGAKI